MGICTHDLTITLAVGFYEEVQAKGKQYNEVKVILTEVRTKRWQTR
jgi:hypothetical protein